MTPWKDPQLDSTLANLKSGQQAAVLAVKHQGQPMCLRLQELGFVPGMALTVISNQGSVMVQVGDQRLCLEEALARTVDVVPV
jgi:Fe2+ transport system protein FeoA